MKRVLSDFEKKMLDLYRNEGFDIVFAEYKKKDNTLRKHLVARDLYVFELFEKYPEAKSDVDTEIELLAEDYPVDSLSEYLVQKYFPEREGNAKKSKRDQLVRNIKSKHPKARAKAIDIALNKPVDNTVVTDDGAFIKQEIKSDGTVDSEKRDLIPRDALEDFREKCKSERYLLELHGMEPDEFNVYNTHAVLVERQSVYNIKHGGKK